MQPAPIRPLADDFQPYGPGTVRPRRIDFDPSDPAFLSREAGGVLRFRLLAPADAVEAMVVVRAGDVNGHVMTRIGAAGSVSVWEAALEPAAPDLACSIAARFANGQAAYVTPTGMASGVERLDRFRVVVADVADHDAPDWASGAVMYQIFPERFASGDPTLDPPGVVPWSVRPTSRSFLGGDLPGITARIDHLVELGVDVVYLNPIFTSPSNHRYDTVDYLQVEPSLGGNAALGELVDQLHARGLRVILDASFNHCHPRFFAFSDLVTNGPDSDYADWFVVHDWPVRVRYRPHLLEPGSYWGVHLDRFQTESGVPVEAVGGDGPVLEPCYDAWYGVPLMPRINLASPAARRYMLDVAAHWVREYDIDGWRMDVVRYVDHDFWADMRREVRRIRSDTYLLAEVMGDARRWLGGDEFDGVMNYTFRDLAVDYFATGTIDTTAFLEGLLELTVMYSPAATALNQNLLSSHDTPRFINLAGGDARALLLASLVQVTFPGIAGIYYGDELAMEGGADPDNRRGMVWDSTGSEHHAAMVGLVRLRSRHPALRRGHWRVVFHSAEAFAYERVLDGERVVTALNLGSREALVPVAGTDRVLWSVGSATASVDGLRLGSRSGAVAIRSARGPDADPGPGPAK